MPVHKKVSKELLEQLYLIEFKSLQEIAHICSASPSSINTWLNEYAIPRFQYKYPAGKHPLCKGYQEISGELFNRIKKVAEKYNREFNLTIEYLWELFLEQNRRCALSGLELSFKGIGRKNRNIGTASLDRINSKLGYTIGNVQWVHKTINHIKTDLDQTSFIKFCKLVAEYNKESNI